MTVQLEPQIDRELSRYAEQHGLSKDDVVKTALLQYLEDREDYEAAAAAIKNRKPGEPTYSSQELRRELGLDERLPLTPTSSPRDTPAPY